MRRTFWSLILLLAVIVVAELSAAAVGTVAVTTSTYAGVRQYKIAWTSSAGGAVSGNPVSITPGEIVAVKFQPSSGGTQPTDAYDATLVDADGVDILNAQAADLSNAAGKYFAFNPPLYFSGSMASQTLDLVIANAGASKGGTVYVWVRSQP